MRQCLFFIVILLIISNLCGRNRDYTGWWIENYGDYARDRGKNDPKVDWAVSVFERVKNVADKGEARLPRLFIINTVGKPYAMAIPDGGIIINSTTLDICYSGVGRKEGDRRLAFILGHELAHLGNKDFMHREAFQALKKYGEEGMKKTMREFFNLSTLEKAKHFKEKEFLADRKGAIYAAMVGYDIGKLFAKKNNFLKYWAQQAEIGFAYDKNSLHPSFEKREQFIRTQLKAVANQVELFNAGVLLFQMDSFHDSEAAFREFVRAYPAREVLNNIGLCNLQLSFQHLALKYKDEYYRFRFSTAIDHSTTALTLCPRGEGDYLKDKDISRYLTKAEEFFRQAVERDKYHKSSRYNLAVIAILKKEYARAQAECDFILKYDPCDVKALNNKAIAFYYYGKSQGLSTTQKAIQILQKTLQLDPENFEVLYNLAALKQIRNRMAGAKQYWEKYLELPTTPKDNFYRHIYRKLTGEEPPILVNKSNIPRLPTGLSLGEEISNIKKKWDSKHKREYKLGSKGNNRKDNWSINLEVLIRNNIRVIALDGILELVEQENPTIENVGNILKRFGTPQKIIPFDSGKFYIYKDKGFSIKEISGRISSYIWYQKVF